MRATPFHRHVLDAELKRRRAANPRYSMRAFAQALGVDPGHLSRVLAGHSKLSVRSAEQVAKRLRLDPWTSERFLLSVVLRDAGRGEAATDDDAITVTRFDGGETRLSAAATIAVDEQMLPLAEVMIREFVRALRDAVGNGNPTTVLDFALALTGRRVE